MATTTEMIVGKYPASLLLDIFSDGMDYAARGFWAQINKYKWYWWYVCDDKGEPIYPQVVSPDLTPDTVLIQMRDDEDGEASICNACKHNDTDHDMPDFSVDGDAVSCHCGCPDFVESRSWTDITLAKLAEATDWALENYNHLFNYRVSKGIREDINYDTIGADVIIQKIVLGDVVYG